MLSNLAYLLLGSNIEPRFNFIASSIERIKLDIGEIKHKSSMYESEPVGFESDTLFINQVVVVKTLLNAYQILDAILEIEQDMGRKRILGKYSSRTIDIDIIYFNNEIINSKDLVVPHPRMQNRLFTLLPLIEIDADRIHPVLGKDHISLLHECTDKNNVRKVANE